jgi:hypothetical protein
MNLRISFKRLFYLLPAYMLLAACSVAPIREESIALKDTSALTLPVQATLAVHMSPDQLRKQYVLHHLFSEYRFEEGMTIQRAAIKVLNRAFTQVLPSGELQNPNWIARVSGSTHIDQVWGTYNANAHLALYDSNNDLIDAFDGKGQHMSLLVNDLNALENAYIKAFTQITDVMLRNERVLSSLRYGSPPKYPADSANTQKAPTATSSSEEKPKGFD